MNCLTCPFIDETTEVRSSSNKLIYLKESLNCQTSGVIYMIRCRNCGVMYVGETCRTLHSRITGHRSDINTQKQTQIARHFNEECPGLDHFSVVPLEHVPRQDPNTLRVPASIRDLLTLLQREQFWISKLGTMAPAGLNKRSELPPPIPLIVRFNDQTGKINKVVREAYNGLQNTLFDTYRKYRLVLACRRNKNLRDILVHSS